MTAPDRLGSTEASAARLSLGVMRYASLANSVGSVAMHQHRSALLV
jgi:hypothetical protein